MIKTEKGTMLNTDAFIANATNSYGANSTIDYFFPLFKSGVVVNNIPAVTFTGYNQYITYEILLPKNSILENYNYISITPYIYQYQNQTVFGSTSGTNSLFKFNLNKGPGLKFVFTFSENIANYYKNQNFIVFRLPSEYLLSDYTFTFLTRLGIIGKIPKKN